MSVAVLAGLSPAFAVLALLYVMTTRMRKPTNIGLHADGDRFVVELHGWDAFYCCRRRVEVPINEVEGVGVYARERVPAQGLRWPGTSLPGVIRAGSFGFRSARDFWDVRKGQEVLVVALKPDAEYRRIVLEVPDPRDEMLKLRPVLGPLDWTP